MVSSFCSERETINYPSGALAYLGVGGHGVRAEAEGQLVGRVHEEVKESSSDGVAEAKSYLSQPTAATCCAAEESERERESGG